MFTNGLGRANGLGMTSFGFRRSMAKHRDRIQERIDKAAAGDPAGWGDIPHPDQLGVGMILEARGDVYGDVRAVGGAEKARRRAKGKRAKAGRRLNRGGR